MKQNTIKNTERSLFTPVTEIIVLFAFIIMILSCQSTAQPVPTEKTLLDLISEGKTEEVRKRFSSADAVNQKNSQGQSLLHIAALRNDAQMVDFLISMKADLTIKDSAGDTAMAAAVTAGCFDAVRVLAEADASIFTTNANGNSVYKLAVNQGPNAVDAILSAKTILQQDKNGKTILHHAVSILDERTVATILAQGTNTSLADADGNTPLFLAYQDPLKEASARIAAQLLLSGAEPVRGTFAYFETAILKRNPAMRFEEGKTPLHIAAANGYSGFVSYLLGRKIPVNVKDSSSSTPLHEAVRNGQVECTQMLLSFGADPNQKDSSGNTPLHLVMPLASRSQIFALLLAAKSNPNQKDSYGETPLHIAARLGMSEEIIRALITAGADTNERNKKGITPLSLAIERSQIIQANLFVQLGADIHAEDIDGNTALSKAMTLSLEMIKAVIIDSNIQTRDSQGRTPLHIAVLQKADATIINYLIEKKADINARDKNGDSPLHIAVRNNDRSSGEILLAHGADVFYPNVTSESALKAALIRMGGREDWVLNSNIITSADGAGNTPLHLAAEWQLSPIISLINEKGGDLNAKNANGETPLFNAVKADSSETIRTLLAEVSERKADINARDFLGNTALHACIRWSALNAAETLIGFDSRSNAKKLINARNLAGKTVLHEAARTGNTNFLKLFLNSAADINASDETGKTALSDAIRAGMIDSVKLLLDKGASPVMQDMYGRNAYHEAVEYSGNDVIILIRMAGGNAMARDSYGRTPLSLAFKKSSETVLTVIGTNTEMVDSDGNTPLHIAIQEQCPADTLRALIAAKFPVNNRNRTGSTALLQAVQKNQIENAQILLSAKADPYASDTMGESAVTIALTNKKNFVPILAEWASDKTDTIGDGLLHYAARIGDADSIRKLLALPKIDRSMRNVAGETAYDIALRWQRNDIANLLK